MTDAPYRGAAGVYELLQEATGKDYGAEAAQVTQLVRQAHPSATTLLDVGCGTGGHLRLLAEHITVEGIDASPDMVALARRRGLVVHEGDMRSFRLPRRFDAVVCLFSAVGYMTTTDDLAAAMATMVRHVVPGGVLLVEGWVHRPDWRDDRPAHVITAAEPDRRAVRMDVTTRAGDRSILEMHYLIGTKGGIQHLAERHEMGLFTERQYRDALEQVGVERVQTRRDVLTGRGLYVGRTRAEPSAEGG